MEITNVTYQGSAVSDAETFLKLPENLQGLLNSLNGFIQFGGGLHIRGAVHIPKWHSISEAWSGSAALFKLYDCVLDTDIPFGQDCVGDQFLLRNKEIWRLSAETGEIENLGLGLSSFFESVSKDPIGFLGMEPLLQLQSEGTELEPGQLIHAYPPFCTKEAANGVSLKPVPAAELILFHAELSSRLPPDGEKIVMQVTD